MRIDKFLNTTNITKRRTISQDMCDSGVVYINGTSAKSSRDVKIGDAIEIKYLSHTKKYRVLAIPTIKSVPKNMSSEYVVEIEQ